MPSRAVSMAAILSAARLRKNSFLMPSNGFARARASLKARESLRRSSALLAASMPRSTSASTWSVSSSIDALRAPSSTQPAITPADGVSMPPTSSHTTSGSTASSSGPRGSATGASSPTRPGCWKPRPRTPRLPFSSMAREMPCPVLPRPLPATCPILAIIRSATDKPSPSATDKPSPSATEPPPPPPKPPPNPPPKPLPPAP
mmetsp:Transcript_38316/g.115701  ORF Transcript_38316/g.115701 Transcript_38316/m.115701 type:complete len:203 (-) Transcript_38316:3-611(-)